MIKATFILGSDYYEVIVDGTNVMFSDASTGQVTTIEGIKLNKAGVVKEFPDLENNPEWNKIAVERFKEHVKKLGSENQRINYVIEEFRKIGYTPLTKQRAGWRPRKIK